MNSPNFNKDVYCQGFLEQLHYTHEDVLNDRDKYNQFLYAQYNLYIKEILSQDVFNGGVFFPHEYIKLGRVSTNPSAASGKISVRLSKALFNS